jgi:hypothetical protein
LEACSHWMVKPHHHQSSIADMDRQKQARAWTRPCLCFIIRACAS